MTTVAWSFIGFLLVFMGVGIYSASRKKRTTEDYLVASRTINPWMAGLSAVASNNSGFMFIGLIGETFSEGVSGMWIMFGWAVGDYLMWMARVPDRLRQRSAIQGSLTLPSFLGHGIPGVRP